MNGPYGTPLALAREPLLAFFWVLIAPILFLTGAAIVISDIVQSYPPELQDGIHVYQARWLGACVGMALWFAAMSIWSERAGAGAFAGAIRTAPRWLIAAALLGPMISIFPSLVIGSFMDSDGWQYREPVDTSVFSPTNWTLAYIAVALVIAPLAEEVAFRGIAFGAIIARGLSPAAAIMLSSVLFAAHHWQYSSAAMFSVFLSGIGLAALRLLSGSVLAPLVAHMTANGVVLYINWVAANPPT